MAQTPKQKTAAKRRALANKTHVAKNKERAQDTIDKRSAYTSAKDDFVLNDVLKFAKDFIAMHNKIAQDGVAARKTGHKLTNGEDEIEYTYLTNNQRAGHLDKSAGLQELVDYVERQLTPVSDALARAASGNK